MNEMISGVNKFLKEPKVLLTLLPLKTSIIVVVFNIYSVTNETTPYPVQIQQLEEDQETLKLKRHLSNSVNTSRKMMNVNIRFL